MSRGLRLALVAALVIGVAVVVGARLLPRDDRRVSVRVEREDFRSVVEATGRLEAAVAFEVGPPSVRDVWSYNLTWMLPEGSQAEKDSVIARFDATQINDRLRERRAELETTLQQREKESRNLEVSLKQLRLDLVKARGELKLVEFDLSAPEEVVSQVEIEKNKRKRKLAERRVEFLERKIDFEQDLVKSKLELLDVKRDVIQEKINYNEEVKAKFNVKAPTGGLVVYIPKQNGDRWDIGEDVWMLAKFLEVADVSTLQVEANLLEVDAARVGPGQSAEIAVDALPGLTLRSNISEVGRIVHERSLQDRSKVFDAILPLDDLDTEELRPGMSVKVSIEVERLPGALTVPLEAVRSAPEGTWVEVRGAGGSPERRAVSLGPRDRERVVVLSGLEEGEQVLYTEGGAA